jgi:hypothetical protein
MPTLQGVEGNLLLIFSSVSRLNIDTATDSENPARYLKVLTADVQEK